MQARFFCLHQCLAAASNADLSLVVRDVSFDTPDSATDLEVLL